MRRIFAALRSVWIWGTSALLILSWVPLIVAVRLFDRDPMRRRTARYFRRLGPGLAKINPWRVHVTGEEHIDHGQAYVVVSNHQSLVDIPVIAHLMVDAKWVAKAELFRTPALGWMLTMARDIPVVRSDRRNAARALLHAVRVLRQGCSVVFFPEGTRSRNGKVLPFSEGPFQMAIREGVPVLPVVVEGSGAALPPNTWLFGGRMEIELRVLAPVPVNGQGPQDAAELRDAVRQMIVDEIERLRA